MRNSERFSKMFYHTSVTAETHQKFIRGAGERDEINWMIENAQTHEPMGLAAMYHMDLANRKCECGRYAMLDPKLFHMTWTVSAYVGVEVIGLHRLYIETLEENTIIARGVERMGMTREGLMRGHVFRDGKPLNVWLFSGITDDWFAGGLRARSFEKWGAPQLVSYEGKKVIK
jgi:RimJ/RimL family protein N-acetyltransferase